MSEGDIDSNGNVVRCTCPHLHLGTRTLEQRNLSPDCPVHGEEAEEAIRRLFGNDDDKARRHQKKLARHQGEAVAEALKQRRKR